MHTNVYDQKVDQGCLGVGVGLGGVGRRDYNRAQRNLGGQRACSLP